MKNTWQNQDHYTEKYLMSFQKTSHFAQISIERNRKTQIPNTT